MSLACCCSRIFASCAYEGKIKVISPGNTPDRRRLHEVEDLTGCQPSGKAHLFGIHVERFSMELDKEAGLGVISLTLRSLPP